jgi:hypothetical protein
MAIYNKLDQETGYGSLKTEADALMPAEPEKSWRRVGVAVAALSVLALGTVAAIKTTSSKRGAISMPSYPAPISIDCLCPNFWEGSGKLEVTIRDLDESDATQATGRAAVQAACVTSIATSAGFCSPAMCSTAVCATFPNSCQVAKIVGC